MARRGIQAAFAVLLVALIGICGTIPVSAEKTDENKNIQQEDSYFQIAFLDVGEGDAAVVVCDGYSMMIDGGPSSKSSVVYSYLQANGLDRLDYIVCTHPDADHCGGLAGALNYAEAGILFCTEKNREIEAFQDFLKYAKKQKNRILVPDAGDTFSLGSAKVTVLAPKRGVKTTENTSIILRIVYGNTSFLFTGDAEIQDEDKLLATKAELKSTVLKAGHHGSNDSTGEDFLKKVQPEYTVISVGGDNKYGHPAQKLLDRLKSTGTKVYRTDMEGMILCESDGKTVTFKTEIRDDIDPFSAAGGIINMKQEEKKAEEEVETQAQETQRSAPEVNEEDTTATPHSTDYIVNTNTGKFHYPYCSSVKRMSEKNKFYYTGTREELIRTGYEPCQNCNP